MKWTWLVAALCACSAVDEMPGALPQAIGEGDDESHERIEALTCEHPTWSRSKAGPGRVRGFATTPKQTLYVLLSDDAGALNLARKKLGGTWARDPLPESCRLAEGFVGRDRLALDAGGVPHVLCGSLGPVSGSDRLAWSLELFTRRSGAWSGQRVASASMAPPDRAIDKGKQAILALAPDGRVHVVYAQGEAGELETYSTWGVDGAWTTPTLVRFQGSLDDFALTTDAAGKPHLAFGWTFHVGENVDHMWWGDSEWQTETLAATGDDESTRGLDIVVHPNGTVFIPRVQHAHDIDHPEPGVLEMLSSDGQTVEIDGARGDGPVDPESAVTITASGEPAVAYHSHALHALRVAIRDDAGGYVRETVRVGDAEDLAILTLPDHALSIAYSDAGNGYVITQRCP